MRSQHSIIQPENIVVLSNQEELQLLEGSLEEIILAKDINGSFFAQGFQNPLPQQPE